MSYIENTNAPSPVVTQADREDAAAGILARLIQIHGGEQPWMDASTQSMRLGEQDDHPEVQAFARHRLAEQERCARVADEHVITADDDVQAAYARAAIDIAEVIRRGQ